MVVNLSNINSSVHEERMMFIVKSWGGGGPRTSIPFIKSMEGREVYFR